MTINTKSRIHQNNIRDQFTKNFNTGDKVTLHINDETKNVYVAGFKIGRYGNKSVAIFGGMPNADNLNVTIDNIDDSGNTVLIDTVEMGVIYITK